MSDRYANISFSFRETRLIENIFKVYFIADSLILQEMTIKYQKTVRIFLISFGAIGKNIRIIPYNKKIF
ncbi:hypothetical protein D3Z58_08955 [Clostridiaceae bacterium]|nr:hypothetical protein [Clostridiaceae bacterium]